MLFWICFILSFLPLIIFYPVFLHGKKNLKELKGKNYIISCNHMSNADPVMLDIKFAKKFIFLAKKELFKKKFPGAVLKNFGGIPVDRQANDTRAIKDVFSALNKGKKVVIFPQATRAKTPYIDETSAKEGVAMFSIRTNTPVVPMMYNKKIKPFRFVKLMIGKPLYPDPERKKDKEYVSIFANEIVAKMNELLQGDKK